MDNTASYQQNLKFYQFEVIIYRLGASKAFLISHPDDKQGDKINIMRSILGGNIKHLTKISPFMIAMKISNLYAVVQYGGEKRAHATTFPFMKHTFGH